MESGLALKAGPCKAERLERSRRPGPTPLKRDPLGAKVSGNGAWGSLRPELRVHSHHQLRPQGFCSHCPVPSSCRGPWHPHALGDGDRDGLRPRGSRHTPRAATLAYSTSRGRRPSSSSALGLASAGIRHSHWPKAPGRANHRRRSALGGRLSLEGLES